MNVCTSGCACCHLENTTHSTSQRPDLCSHAYSSNEQLLTHKLLKCLCCRITRDMYPARAASYSTFVPPYSYAAMFRLLQKQGLMQSDGLCHPDADLYNSFSCPPNTTKVAEIDMPEHCRQSNVSACPQVDARIPASRHAHDAHQLTTCGQQARRQESIHFFPGLHITGMLMHTVLVDSPLVYLITAISSQQP